MIRLAVRYLVALALAIGGIAALPGVASATTYAQIEGTGSTWSQLIVNQWIADVDANGIQVVYTGGGSSKGRKDFAQDSVDFAISEIPYQGTDEQGNADTSNGREYAYLPIVAGGTAFTYQLKIGNTLVRNLRLSGETLTKIFCNIITNWDDPEITKDNNGRAFPSLPITPVVRSDGSGTTAQLTTWMDNQYPSIWRPFFGKSGLTSYFPIKGRAIGQAGSDQVMNTVASFAGNGTIGYVEYSYPLNSTAPDGKPFPVVKVLNKGGYYVEPTQYNTAVALTKAKINQDKTSQLYLTQILDGVYNDTDPRAYPISSYSYMIIPTGANDPRMTTAKRQSLADFMYYSLCTGQTKAGTYGYSPLPLNLVQAGFEQLAKLKQADPNVDLTNRDVTKCNNPTFVAGNLSENHLADIAPLPAACDKDGAGPCDTDTGTGAPSTDQSAPPGSPVAVPTAPASTGGGGSTTAPTGSGGGAAGNPTAPASGAASSGASTGTTTGTTPGTTTGTGTAPVNTAPQVDPNTGQVTSAPVTGTDPGTTTGTTTTGGTSAPTTTYANPTTLSSDRPLDNRTFSYAAVVLLLGLILSPGAFLARRRRRDGGSSR